MTVVWMNHWFSTAYNIIRLMKQNRDDLHIIGTNESEYSIIKNVCDEWYTEPVLREDQYVEYCLDFCKEHHVQYFLPRRGMLIVSKHKRQFEEIGVRVMIEEYNIMHTLNHKEKAYDFFRKHGLGSVPDYRIVTNAAGFLGAYNELKESYNQICFKFVKDEGGKSFRLIDNQRKGYAALFKKQNTRMTLGDVMEALSERDEFAPIMMMPFLPDNEISVDCLNTEKGLIALPRIKGYCKYEQLRFDDEIIALCKEFQYKAGLLHPYNIQFKYLAGIPYFLEVNTRMSGGIHMSCYASGVNIPQIALRQLCGENVDWQCNRETQIISQVLYPVTIK